MNIQSAEKHIDSLLRYVKDLQIEKPRMYKKSKERLLDIAVSCNLVVCTISDILRDELMSVDVDEFEGNSSTEISDIIKSMESTLSNLVEFSNTNPNNDYHSKDVYKLYCDVLKFASRSESSSSVAERCAKLMWRWFDSRFIKSKNDRFVYNIQMFKRWIPNFVILFSYYHKNNDIEQFETDVNEWVVDVMDNRNMYAIPKEIYYLEQTHESKYYTVESVILWDLMLDLGFSKICDINQSYFPYSDCVYDLCYNYNPDELNNYVNYKTDLSILFKYRFLEGGE